MGNPRYRNFDVLLSALRTTAQCKRQEAESKLYDKPEFADICEDLAADLDTLADSLEPNE